MNELEQIKKKAHEKGFNMSMLINRFKKKQRERGARYEIPDEVYIEVCKDFLKYHEDIKQAWPYFMVVLKQKSGQYFANKHQSEHKSQEFNRSMPENIRSIFDRLKSNK